MSPDSVVTSLRFDDGFKTIKYARWLRSVSYLATPFSGKNDSFSGTISPVTKCGMHHGLQGGKRGFQR